ncbi:MAG: hypothetical protein WB630_05360 [Candidatus Acidiferrales bacterium]
MGLRDSGALMMAGKGHWGEGLTAADMEKCNWLEPRLVAAIDYAEWRQRTIFGTPSSSEKANTSPSA